MTFLLDLKSLLYLFIPSHFLPQLFVPLPHVASSDFLLDNTFIRPFLSAGVTSRLVTHIAFFCFITGPSTHPLQFFFFFFDLCFDYSGLPCIIFLVAETYTQCVLLNTSHIFTLWAKPGLISTSTLQIAIQAMGWSCPFNLSIHVMIIVFLCCRLNKMTHLKYEREILNIKAERVSEDFQDFYARAGDRNLHEKRFDQDFVKNNKIFQEGKQNPGENKVLILNLRIVCRVDEYNTRKRGLGCFSYLFHKRIHCLNEHPQSMKGGSVLWTFLNYIVFTLGANLTWMFSWKISTAVSILIFLPCCMYAHLYHTLIEGSILSIFKYDMNKNWFCIFTPHFGRIGCMSPELAHAHDYMMRRNAGMRKPKMKRRIEF
ncbi:putative signal peptide protein [Puccinia sorghi]|uniref:Putative signal peptide protein n=1 Tax=Puccinia sorghi TaxID=27349 RepID=A0A0L6UIR1_9BASI|nr:putative signal peptide protein [Puccinia sorghi]